MLAAAKEVPGLWPFALPLVFTVAEDPAADLHADRFSQPPPAGIGLAQALAAPGAPLSPALLVGARAHRRALASQPPPPPDKLPPAPPDWLPRALLVVCTRASTLVGLARKEWVGAHLGPAVMVALGAGVPALAEAALKTLSEQVNVSDSPPCQSYLSSQPRPLSLPGSRVGTMPQPILASSPQHTPAPLSSSLSIPAAAAASVS